jgi:hypothetical protein
MNVRTIPKLVAAAAAGTLLLGSAAAVAATSSSASHPARIEVWVSPAHGNSAVQKIMITGAIGDFGKATSTTKSGKPNPNGKYVHIVLQKGTFRVNAVALNNKLATMRPHVNKSTCSAWGAGSGPVTLFDGTGRYAGISGRIKITTSFAAIFPRFGSGPKKGQCNHSNHAMPLAFFTSPLTGAGKVTLPSG